jgi:5-methylcytosine-specific restriction endonuclease McrA
MRWFKCTLCNEHYPEECFYADKSKKSGKRPRCKQCDKKSVNTIWRREYERDYWSVRKEEKSKILSRWYIKNKDKHNSQQAKYRKTLSFYEKHREHGAARRARVRGQFVERVDYASVFAKYDGKCVYCGAILTFNQAHFDHFIPISKGGLHKTENIRLSCELCNKRKGAKMPSGVGYPLV